MPLSVSDDDEFDVVSDIEFDRVAEESLVQIEEQHRLLATQLQRAHDSGANKDGASRRHVSTAEAAAPGDVGIDDFRISHQGRVLPGHNLPRGDSDEYGADNDASWRGMDLDTLENDAIVASQRSTASRNRSPESKPAVERAPRATGVASSKRPRSADANEATEATTSSSKQRVNGAFTAEVAENNARVHELMRRLEEKDDELKRAKRELQAKMGEVTILRANTNRSIAENSALFKEKEEDLASQRALARDLKQKLEERETELKTVQTFRGFEAGTNSGPLLWSSISASVARRRAGQASIRRDYSQSHSLTAAAAVGLTTPTRRNRGSNRNLGSPSSGDDRTRGQTIGEESPSSRRARAQAAFKATEADDSGNYASGSGMKKKTAFPGFVNSFARPALPTPVIKEPKNKQASFGVERGFSPAPLQPSTRASPEPQTGDAGVLQDDFTRRDTSEGSQPQQRYYWAVSTYARRQAFLASLVLSHTSAPCPSEAATGHQKKGHIPLNYSTLQRLLEPPSNVDKHVILYAEYVLATHFLLNALSQGAAMDAEDRFAYLLDTQESDSCGFPPGDQDHAALLFECINTMDVGLSEVLEGVGLALRVMMAVSFKLGLYERVYDVFVLLRAISIHHAAMARLFVLPATSGFTERMQGFEDDHEEEQDSLEKGNEDEIEKNRTQASARASFNGHQRARLTLDFDRIAIACILRLCPSPFGLASMPSEKASPQTPHRRAAAASEDGEARWLHLAQTPSPAGAAVLHAVIGVIEVLCLEVHHNDSVSLRCTYTIRAILSQGDVLASLLESKRDATIIERVLGILTVLLRHESLWRVILACNLDKHRKSLRPARLTAAISAGAAEDSALFTVLAKILVDGRLGMSGEGMHAVHCAVINFLLQLVICHPDEALLLVAGSGTILAGLTKCLQLDTDMIWTESALAGYEHSAPQDEHEWVQAAKRIEMDVRFLAYVYVCDGDHEHYSLGEQLAKKLASYETQLLLNGIRHYFVVALSRIAYAPEPEWMLEEGDHSGDEDDSGGGLEGEGRARRLESARTALNSVNEAAAELLELILSPDEIESCWEALNDEMDDEEEDDEDEATAAAEAAASAGSQERSQRMQQQSHMQSQMQTRTRKSSAPQEHDSATIIVSDTDDDEDSETQMSAGGL